MISWLNSSVFQFLKWIGVDRAVAYFILDKVWRLFAGLTTMLMISHFLSPEAQGFYFTFISLLALQAFVELGFSLVITPFASHEWVSLSWDGKGSIRGEEKALSRLVSLGQLVVKWYVCASLLLVSFVSLAGFYFFSQQPDSGIGWQEPWFVAVFLAGVQLCYLPFYSILEGCQQIKNAYLFRLIKAVFGSLAIWLVMYFGGSLWMVATTIGVGVIIDSILVFGRYRGFFRTFISVKPTEKIDWRDEIFPMQWRIALGAIATYFRMSIFTPIIFHYHGSVAAGKFGMTWQAIEVLGTLAHAWIFPKVPRYSIMIAQKKYAELDRYFLRNSIISVMVVLIGAVIGLLLIYGLNEIGHHLAQRLLPPFPTAVLFLAATLIQIPNCMSSYLRCHKKDPLLGVQMGFGLSCGLSVWLLGSQYGPLGLALGFLGTVSLVLLPWESIVFYRCRKEWHR